MTDMSCRTKSGLAILAIALAACAQANVVLNGASEAPPVNTSASGSGAITVWTDGTLNGSITTYGVAGTAAHLHTGAAGKNGPVAVPMVKNGDDGWSIPHGARLTDAQFQSYKNGELYVNVHSAANKAGEIRGQLKPW